MFDFTKVSFAGFVFFRGRDKTVLLVLLVQGEHPPKNRTHRQTQKHRLHQQGQKAGDRRTDART